MHGAFAKGVCAQALSRVLRSQARVDGRVCRLDRGERLNTALTMNYIHPGSVGKEVPPAGYVPSFLNGEGNWGARVPCNSLNEQELGTSGTFQFLKDNERKLEPSGALYLAHHLQKKTPVRALGGRPGRGK